MLKSHLNPLVEQTCECVLCIANIPYYSIPHPLLLFAPLLYSLFIQYLSSVNGKIL